MTLSAPAGFASSDLVYEENFSGTALDSDWHTYITSNAANGWPWNTNGSGGSTPGGPYNADYDMPSQVSVSNGTLDLTAIKQPISGVNQGGVTQTFPITSGAVSSYGNFEFNGGYLQISMKAPSGGGAWPGLWLMPGDGAGSMVVPTVCSGRQGAGEVARRSTVGGGGAGHTDSHCELRCG